MFLLDTMIVSESGKRLPNPRVAAWLAGQSPERCFLSVISIAEIERGIALAERRDGRFAVRVRSWLEDALAGFGDRVLPMTVAIARLTGRMQAEAGPIGNDVAIGATALSHGFTVVTRNIRDFAPLGVETLNPYE